MGLIILTPDLSNTVSVIGAYPMLRSLCLLSEWLLLVRDSVYKRHHTSPSAYQHWPEHPDLCQLVVCQVVINVGTSIVSVEQGITGACEYCVFVTA